MSAYRNSKVRLPGGNVAAAGRRTFVLCLHKRRRGAAPGDEVGVCEVEIGGRTGFTVDKWLAVHRNGRSASSAQDCVTGRRIPFHGAGEAGVDIGLAFGQQAEF